MPDIKTYEDACRAVSLDPNVIPDISMFPKDEQKAILAHYKLIVIAKALNGGWKPNWDDENEYKYYPWFDMQNGFSFLNYGCRYQLSGVGSRLCFKSAELAQYAGTQFLDLYKDYFTFSN